MGLGKEKNAIEACIRHEACMNRRVYGSFVVIKRISKLRVCD